MDKDNNFGVGNYKDFRERGEKYMFYSDKPIETCQDDVLKRGNFARLMAKSLINFKNDDTFTIGLYGRWGNGKTSLVNMMLQEVNKHQNETDNLIVIRFDPWNFSTTDQLLEQFFVRLRNVFCNSKDKNFAKIGEAIENYSDALNIFELVPHAGGVLSFAAKKGARKLGKHLQKDFNEKDVFKQKENVIKLLEKQSKRIVIIIDDIDRLNNEQIRQIFQLITSVAKFPNTTYLLVFDKDIVVKALEKVQEGSGEEYLEKIIQMPIQIPDIQKGEFRKVLFDRLDKIINENKGVLFEEVYWQRMFSPCVEPLLKNLRDINRLCNLLQFKLSSMSAEVNFVDLLIVSGIELAYPQIFTWIKRNKNVLTGEYDENMLLSRKKTQSEQYDIYYLKIKATIEQSGGHIEDENIKLLLGILVRLFPYFGNYIGLAYETYDQDLLRKNNCIAHPEKFERYFDLNIECVTLKSNDLAYAIYNLNAIDLANYIVDLDKEDVSYNFLEEIKAIMDDFTGERAKVIIEAIFLCTYKLDMVTRKSLFSNSSRNYAEHLILPLFEKIEKEKRMIFWTEILNCSDLETLPAMADVINMLELAYGRLAAKGDERGYEKVITLDELLQLEELFANKVKELLHKNSLFDFADHRMVLYLMENYEPEFIESRIQEEFLSNRNVLLYLENTVSTWIGNEVSYEIYKNYEKRLTKERILEAIQQEREKKTLYELPLDNQRICMAFYMHENGEVNYLNHISQKEVDKKLDEWKRC